VSIQARVRLARDAREAIFHRFHSITAERDFGRHSGLGLASAAPS